MSQHNAIVFLAGRVVSTSSRGYFEVDVDRSNARTHPVRVYFAAGVGIGTRVCVTGHMEADRVVGETVEPIESATTVNKVVAMCRLVAEQNPLPHDGVATTRAAVRFGDGADSVTTMAAFGAAGRVLKRAVVAGDRVGKLMFAEGYVCTEGERATVRAALLFAL